MGKHGARLFLGLLISMVLISCFSPYFMVFSASNPYPLKLDITTYYPRMIPAHYYKLGDNTRTFVTSYGNYTMDKAKPFYMSYRDWNNTLQVSNSVFWVNTTSVIDIAKANGVSILVENSAQFKIGYNAVYKGGSLTKDSNVGRFEVQWLFYNEKIPKLTITFTKTGNWTTGGLGDFNIIWVVLPTQPYVRYNDTQAIPYTALTVPTAVPYANQKKKIELGNTANPFLWHSFSVIDWSDVGQLNTFAYCGAEKVFGGKGITIKFPTNVERIDPTITLDVSNKYDKNGSVTAPTVSITTTADYELLILDTQCVGNYYTSITSSPSLTWIKRASIMAYGGAENDTRLYAEWSSHGAITVTVNLNGAGSADQAVLYAIQNYDNGTSGAIFDRYTNIAQGGGIVSGQFNNSNANDMIIVMGGSGVDSVQSLSAPWVLIQSMNGYGGLASYYQTVSATGVYEAVWSGWHHCDIIDAVREYGSPSPTTTSTTTTTTTATSTTTTTETSTTTTQVNFTTTTTNTYTTTQTYTTTVGGNGTVTLAVHDPIGPTILPSYYWELGVVIVSLVFFGLAFKWVIFGFIGFCIALVVFVNDIAYGWAYDVAYSNGTHIIQSSVSVPIPTWYLSVMGIILLIEVFGTIYLMGRTK